MIRFLKRLLGIAPHKPPPAARPPAQKVQDIIARRAERKATR